MIQEKELIMLILGVCVIFFLMANYGRIKRYPAVHILIAGFGFLFSGWCLTILEGFWLGDVFNIAEHLCYLASAGFVARWVWVVGINNAEIK